MKRPHIIIIDKILQIKPFKEMWMKPPFSNARKGELSRTEGDWTPSHLTRTSPTVLTGDKISIFITISVALAARNKSRRAKTCPLNL